MKKVKSIIMLIMVILAIIPSVSTAQVLADDADDFEVTIDKDLKASDDCKLVDKDELSSRFYTIDDSKGKLFFCLDESEYYPDHGGYIPNDEEVTTDAIRWLVYNFEANKSYFEQDNINELTAYGATQIAIWSITNNITGPFIDNNPIVVKLIKDAKVNKFPKLQEMLDSYSLALRADKLKLKNGDYETHIYPDLQTTIAQSEKFITPGEGQVSVFYGDKDITNSGDIKLKKDNINNSYELSISKKFIENNSVDKLSVRYNDTLYGKGLAIMEASPEQNSQNIAYTNNIEINKELNKATPLELNEAKGKIQVKKVDEQGSVLKGAEFTLTDQDGHQVKALTDQTGLATFDISALNVYKLEETKNPDGYTGHFVKEGITLENDGETFNYTATNTLSKGKIQVKKVDEKGTPLKGAEFTLTDQAGKQVKSTTDDNGLASFDIAALHVYKLEETKNPEGYTGHFVKEGITLENDGETFNYKVVNEKQHNDTDNDLPSTGEYGNSFLFVSGLVLIVAVLYTAIIKRYSHK